MEKQTVVRTTPSKTNKFDAFKDMKLEDQQAKQVKGGDGEEGDDTGIVGEIDVVDL